ncbi:outer membrane channel protein TolC [Methylosoma difficile]
MSKNILNTTLYAPLIVLLTMASLPTQAEDLASVYKLALENDPTLKAVRANQMATDESKNQSIAQFLPNISSIGIASRDNITNNNPNSFLRSQSFWNNSLVFSLNQPIFHWEHWVKLSQSDNQIAQAEAEYKAELQNLMTKTTEAYFNVLLAEDNYSFAMGEKDSVYQQLEQSKRLFANHLIPITDVHEAEAGYEQATANEIDAANKVDDAKEALKEIIGDHDVKLTPLLENVVLQKPEPADINVWSHTAEASNFSVIAAINATEVARKNIDLQRTGHYPSLDLVGTYNISDVGSNFGIQGDRQTIGLQLNVPLFAGGSVNSKTQQAAYLFEAAKENLNTIKRATNRQIKVAYRGVTTSIKHIEALQASLKASEKALKSSELGFEEGTRTMVDVLSEQTKLFEAKREYARARYDYFINSVKLKQAASSLDENDLEQINKFLANYSAKK